MDAQSTGFENRHGTRRFAQMAVRLTFIARRALCDWHRNPYCCPFWDNHYNVLLQDSRRSAGDKLRSHPLLLLAGKDCGHEDLEQEQNEAEHRHDETVELTTRKHSIVSATLVITQFVSRASGLSTICTKIIHCSENVITTSVEQSKLVPRLRLR